MNYNLVVNEDILKEWFAWAKTDLRYGESFMACLSARNKRLNAEERKLYDLARSEMMKTKIISFHRNIWNYNVWVSSLFEYNFDKRALTTPMGVSLPEKCLVVYDFLNPSSEVACLTDTQAHIASIQKELIDAIAKNSKEGQKVQMNKLIHSGHHLKSCHAQNVSRKLFIDYDYDLDEGEDAEKVKEILSTAAKQMFGEGNYKLVKTGGGYHVPVRKEVIKFNPQNYIDSCVELLGYTPKEFKQNKNGFIPCPGTLQYGKLVELIS